MSTNEITKDWPEIDKSMLIEALKTSRSLKAVAKEIVLNLYVDDISLTQDAKDMAIQDYYEINGIEKNVSLQDLVKRTIGSQNELDVSLLEKIIMRPFKVLECRQRRWGHLASSIYVKDKEEYETITYNIVKSEDSDWMQEVYFRLKDNEATWEQVSEIFYSNRESHRKGPIRVTEVDRQTLETLKLSGVGKVTKPTLIGGLAVVMELIDITPNKYNEEIEKLILRKEFEKWLDEQTNQLIKEHLI